MNYPTNMHGLKEIKRLSTIRDDELEDNLPSNEPLNGEGPLFQQYLEKQGILEFLTNELLQLYIENRPENGLDVLKRNISAQLGNKMKLETKKETILLHEEILEMENESLKFRVDDLEKENKKLTLQLEKLKNN